MSITTRTIPAADLQSGDTLIEGDQRLTITGSVDLSDDWASVMRIEVGFGVLYLPANEQVTVLVSQDDDQAWADVIVGPNGSVTDETNAHHVTTGTGLPVATKLHLSIPDTLAGEDEIAEWVGQTAQRIITAGGPGTTLTVYVGDGQ